MAKTKVCLCCTLAPVTSTWEHEVFCEPCKDLLNQCDVNDPVGSYLKLRHVRERAPPHETLH